MKAAGKSAIRPWLICPYNENALVDLPSSVVCKCERVAKVLLSNLYTMQSTQVKRLYIKSRGQWNIYVYSFQFRLKFNIKLSNCPCYQRSLGLQNCCKVFMDSVILFLGSLTEKRTRGLVRILSKKQTIFMEFFSKSLCKLKVDKRQQSGSFIRVILWFEFQKVCSKKSNFAE